jgi:hypothetical protein
VRWRSGVGHAVEPLSSPGRLQANEFTLRPRSKPDLRVYARSHSANLTES